MQIYVRILRLPLSVVFFLCLCSVNCTLFTFASGIVHWRAEHYPFRCRYVYLENLKLFFFATEYCVVCEAIWRCGVLCLTRWIIIIIFSNGMYGTVKNSSEPKKKKQTNFEPFNIVHIIMNWLSCTRNRLRKRNIPHSKIKAIKWNMKKTFADWVFAHYYLSCWLYLLAQSGPYKMHIQYSYRAFFYLKI